MPAHRASLAVLAVTALFAVAVAGACAPAVSADAPVVTYYYIPG